MKRKYFIIILFGATFYTSCTEEKNEESLISEMETAMEREETFETSEQTKQKEMEINNIIASMPSPLEIVSSIKQSGAPFNLEILNKIENKALYETEYKKALNIGIYGTDMSYINIYSKKIHVLNYARVIQNLSEELSVGHFFDLATFTKMIENENNMDSLILLSTRNYNDMDHFLREQGRGEVSALMAVGAWTEGIHILLEINKHSNDPKLKEKIGEQKIVIELLSEILSFYKNQEKLAELITQIGKINEIYKEVNEEIIEGEMTTKEVDGMLVVMNTGGSIFKVSDEQINAITLQVNSLRKLITQIK